MLEINKAIDFPLHIQFDMEDAKGKNVHVVLYNKMTGARATKEDKISEKGDLDVNFTNMQTQVLDAGLVDLEIVIELGDSKNMIARYEKFAVVKETYLTTPEPKKQSV